MPPQASSSAAAGADPNVQTRDVTSSENKIERLAVLVIYDLLTLVLSVELSFTRSQPDVHETGQPLRS
jgi:hypothetical protein